MFAEVKRLNENVRSAKNYTGTRQVHWNNIAIKYKNNSSLGAHCRKYLYKIFRFLVAPGQRVLELGCGTGDLLDAIKPSFGLGIDFSEEMIKIARSKHPHLEFIQADAHHFSPQEPFDIIILSDLLKDLFDVQTLFERIRKYTTPNTLIVLNCYSRLWELPLGLGRKLGLASPQLPQNWLTCEDISNILNLTGFSVVRCWPEILFPIQIPILTKLTNRFIAKIWPLTHLCLTNFMVIRCHPPFEDRNQEPTVSVVIPARNEEGNIREIITRTPDFCNGIELIFVEGNSQDNTFEVIEQAIKENPEKNCKLFKQEGVGKGDAVRLGFAKATGDILMILDADMTVPPETLPRFYNAIKNARGSFINGVRLVYPMEKEAMRFFNLLGNKFFSLAFSWLLGQSVKDTLCGTKVLWKDDHNRIAENRKYFGDFDLLFGAAKLNLKIIEIPIRYRERKYGNTNIQRWKHGLLLFRMAIFASLRFKFI